MAAPTETISTENVVASTAVGQELNLKALAMDLAGADYDPDRFPGLVYRSDAPKSAALVFRSGKVVITGATSEANVDVLDPIVSESVIPNKRFSKSSVQ